MALLAKYSCAGGIDQHIQNCRQKKGQADFPDELSFMLLSRKLQLQPCILNSSMYQHYLCCEPLTFYLFFMHTFCRSTFKLHSAYFTLLSFWMAVRHRPMWHQALEKFRAATGELSQGAVPEYSICLHKPQGHCSLIFEHQKVLVSAIPASFYRRALTVTPPKSKLLQEKVPTATKGIGKDFALEAEAGWWMASQKADNWR